MEAWELLKEIQPLPNSHRRLLVTRFASGLNHRDEQAVYRWLSGRYIDGELPRIVDAMQSEWKGGRAPYAALKRWLQKTVGDTWEAGDTPKEAIQVALGVVGPTDPRFQLLQMAERLFGSDAPGNDTHHCQPEKSPPVCNTAAASPEAVANSLSIIEQLAAVLPQLEGSLSAEIESAAQALLQAAQIHIAWRESVADARALLHVEAAAALATLPDSKRPPPPEDDTALAAIPQAVAIISAAIDEEEKCKSDLVAALAGDLAINYATAGARLEAAKAALGEAWDTLLAICTPSVVREPVISPEPTAAAGVEQLVADGAAAAQVDRNGNQAHASDLALGPAAGAVPDPADSRTLCGSLESGACQDSAPIEAPLEIKAAASPPVAVEPPVQAPPELPAPSEPESALAEVPTVGNSSVASSWDTWILNAVEEGFIALALQLGQARDVVGATMPASLPQAVLEALLAGSKVRRTWDAASIRYQDAAQRLIVLPDEEWTNPAMVILALAGALRPALLMSESAALILSQARVDGLAGPLHRLSQACQQMSTMGIGDLSDVSAPPDAAEVQRRRASAEEELRSWFTSASTRTTNFGRASAAWRALVAPGGRIGMAVGALLVDPFAAEADARDLLSRLEDSPDQLLAEADQSVSDRSRNSPIEGTARKKLLALLAEANERIDSFLSSALTQENRADRYKAIRGQLVKALEGARAAAVSLGPGDKASAMASRVFVNAATRLIEVLEGQRSAVEGDLSNMLMTELARLTDFPINGRQDVRFDADHWEDVLALERAAAVLAYGVPTSSMAFEAALQLGNTTAAQYLVAFQSDQARSVERIEVSKEPQRTQLLERASGLRLLLDDYQAALSDDDPLPEQLEREMASFEPDAIRQLPRLVAADDGINDFPTARIRLDSIAARLSDARAKRAAALRLRIAELETKLGCRLPNCSDMLDAGDLATLTEELAQIERHGLVESRPRSPTAALDISLNLAEPLGDTGKINLAALLQSAKAGGAQPPYDFSNLPDADRSRAVALLDSWLGIRREFAREYASREGKSAELVAVKKLAEAVGFTGVQATRVTREPQWIRASIITDTLANRDSCLVPAFGSQARGNYTFLFVRETGVNSLVNTISTVPEGAIVFIIGLLHPRAREKLLVAARSGSKPIAIADDLTIVSLTQLPDADLRSFFDLSLAWGHAEPYSDVSEQTSIEMFFGRERELGALARLDGPCLVYGGRQLGKTALLKQVELREHAGDRVAIYCKIQRIGETEPTNRVWHEIEQRLAQLNVKLPDSGNTPELLQQWVSQKAGRSMIIMLDEADAFLESEMANRFPTLDRIRSLMNDTNRRVKFIFAGLHNVQRFHLAPNSPLLHFGTPVNVGPLMGSDWEAARRMAIDPMAALGFSFQSANDATYMLSLVGFYPSLMQSFGKAVVREANRMICRREARPAFRISRAVIDRCFASQEFREDVVGKFRKTLQLDARYELLTYALWLASRNDSPAGQFAGRGYPASAIREMADEWWPAGFQDTQSLESFAALLDEMEQMGVLAKDGVHYRLRSRRIAAMLGSPGEIEDRLTDFLQRPPRRPIDPLCSHRLLGVVWSPLSLRQERLLKDHLEGNHPVALVGGVPAAGASHIVDGLKAMANDLSWPDCRVQMASATIEDLLAVAAAHRKEARPGRPKLIIVHGRWPSQDELERVRIERVLRDAERPVRIVYTGPPDADLFNRYSGRVEVLRLLLSPMSADTLRHWLRRMDFDMSDEAMIAAQEMLREVTGGWLQILDQIKLPPKSGRSDAALLKERAVLAAETATLADFGMDDRLVADARRLHELIGSEAETIGALKGFDDLAEVCGRLAMLGVVEVPPDQPAYRRFNTLVLRRLSAS